VPLHGFCSLLNTTACSLADLKFVNGNPEFSTKYGESDTGDVLLALNEGVWKAGVKVVFVVIDIVCFYVSVFILCHEFTLLYAFFRMSVASAGVTALMDARSLRRILSSGRL
jgi:hypothetical protein